MLTSFILIASMFVAIAARADLPRGAVNLTVRPLVIRESRNTPWQTDYGSYERFTAKSVAIQIDVRRTVRGEPGVWIEWYFLARDASTREPFVFDAARAHFSLREGFTERFSVTSGAVSDTDTKYAALGRRYRDGEKLWGSVVIVRSGHTVVASEGSLFEVKEWLMKGLDSGTVDFAPPASKKKNA